jgi:isopentenyl-diphosphate delta-isomerase
MNELITLVDQNDVSLGPIEKLEAHKKGLLHRAFSVFIFNSKGELLIQQRADGKYHSAGLWTNTCCSHPNYNETTTDAIRRRMKEEIGMVADVEFKFKFTYKAVFENQLTEYEVDHVYFGFSDDSPIINPDEVKDWNYIKMEDLQKELNNHPENYTRWLIICFPDVLKHFKSIVF